MDCLCCDLPIHAQNAFIASLARFAGLGWLGTLGAFERASGPYNGL